MINVEKTITDNPFVDNMIYYAKYLALNCNIKDEDEALENETIESLKNGDIYIQCIENRAPYEIFTYIPTEILENYIQKSSNLDVLTKTDVALKTYLNSLDMYEKERVLRSITKTAQTVYIDHYNVMMNYITNNPTWLHDYKDLYDDCVNGLLTYNELFNTIPEYTRKRILVQYLNNYDNTDIDLISKSLTNFKLYVNGRSDDNINNELEYINKAMRDIFISHYDIMKMRGYLSEDGKNNWYDYIASIAVYNKCVDGTATYKDLLPLMPTDDLKESLYKCIGEEDTELYTLYRDTNTLAEYFQTISTNPTEQILSLNNDMTQKYIRNYNYFLNTDVYYKCIDNAIDFFELMKYIPTETLKIILNTEIEEVTNIQVYANSKEMLNSYLATLPLEQQRSIKESIAKDMNIWYVQNYIEKNNYYRTFLGLPRLKDNGIQYKDTLMYSGDPNIGSDDYINFGDKFIKEIQRCTNNMYPDSHWKTELCEFDNYDISILNEYGILDQYVAACKSNMYSSRYAYIRFLGDNKLDIYNCRKALNFQLIGIPEVDNTSVKNKFIDTYTVNRSYIMKTVYSDAYKFQSDYYNKFIIIFILTNTIMDMLAGISKMLIDRDVFDSRCIKYLFESFGIPYYSEIPVKYQQAMLKNLNILIKYKSSTRNMIDVCNLFGFSDIRVFGYYLFKERVKDSNTGKFVFNEDNDISYDLDLLYVRDDSNGSEIDYNGIRYTKLLDYRKYDENKYLKKIYVEDDNGNVIEKTIINNKSEVYIKEKSNKTSMVIYNAETGLYENVKTESGEVTNSFIPLLETSYFKDIKADTDTAVLKFIKVPITESVIDYKNDDEYIIPYDEIVYADQGNTWDGGLEHEDLKNDILDYEFNAVRTKYISIETITEMTELAFQVSYFYNMLFDNLYSEEHLTVDIPYIKIGHKFKFVDVVCYLFALMYYYNDLKDNIMYSPTQILYIKGYNFDNNLNKILDDTLAFTQEKDISKRENIFDVNNAISQIDYNYQEAFKDYRIKSFNLDADIDALDDWLAQFQLSLDDFIVYDKDQAKANGFNQVITLRNFYSLNNSFYQKNIFEDNLLPTQYNQEIKYAFDQKLFTKYIIKDLLGEDHVYIDEDISGIIKKVEVFEPLDEFIYIKNYEYYLSSKKGNTLIYYKYIKNENNYVKVDKEYYIYKNGEYKSLFNGYIYIKDKNNNYIFSADGYYMLINGEYVNIAYGAYTVDESTADIKFVDSKTGEDIPKGDYYILDNGIYTKNPNASLEVAASDCCYIDDNDRLILRYGIYYILKNGQYVLDPENCYIIVEKNGKSEFVLVKDLDGYQNEELSPDDLFIYHSDGHFIPLKESDFYRKQPDGSYIYDEEECFIKSNKQTEYYDASVYPRVYYMRVSDYYGKNNYIHHQDMQYVKDEFGNFIPESNLINPDNCYFKENDNYYAVKDYIYEFKRYQQDISTSNTILVLQENNNYNRFILDNDSYKLSLLDNLTYVKDSNPNFILGLFKNSLYKNTSSMIVVFNKPIYENTSFDDSTNNLYDPESTDKIWDENDWFYEDASYDQSSLIGMNGENKWYYKSPEGETHYDEDPDDVQIGSGFSLKADTYLSSKIEEGNKYYIALDIETNFTGLLQVRCEADSGNDNSDALSRIYNVKDGIKMHIDQTFTANNISSPSLNFLIYNFKDYPIEVGDYIIVSNIRVMKAFNNQYIPQDVPSYDKLQELYKTNTAIYKYLVTMMANCSDYDTYQIYKKLYDAMMTAEYNKEAFKLEDGTYATTYTEFLQTRDPILYERLTYFLNLDRDTMHKEIADNIIQVTYAIDDCVDTYSYGYLYSYFPAVSATYIQQYISKIINFFKSWKVHLLGINTIYKFDDVSENTVKILEDQEYKIKLDDQVEHVYINDTACVNPMDAYDPAGHKYNDKYEDLVQFSHKFNDSVNIDDRVRIIVSMDNMIKYTDNYENIHLILDTDYITAMVNSDGELIIKDDRVVRLGDTENLIIYKIPQVSDATASATIKYSNSIKLLDKIILEEPISTIKFDGGNASLLKPIAGKYVILNDGETCYKIADDASFKYETIKQGYLNYSVIRCNARQTSIYGINRSLRTILESEKDIYAVNDLIYETDNDDQYNFGSQKIHSINDKTTDIM